MDTVPGSSPRSWVGVRVRGQASPKTEPEEKVRAEPASERQDVRGESNARANMVVAAEWLQGGG